MRDILTRPDRTDHAKRTLPRELCAKVGQHRKTAPQLAFWRLWRAVPAASIATAAAGTLTSDSAGFAAARAGMRLGISIRERPAGHVALPPTYRILATIARRPRAALLPPLAGGREGGEDDWPNQSFFPPSHPPASACRRSRLRTGPCQSALSLRSSVRTRRSPARRARSRRSRCRRRRSRSGERGACPA